MSELLTLIDRLERINGFLALECHGSARYWLSELITSLRAEAAAIDAEVTKESNNAT